MKDIAEVDQSRTSIGTVEDRQQEYRSESYRRSKMEIYLDILGIIKNGVDRPTRIMYKANLSWKPFQETLKFMLDRDLIAASSSEEHDETRKTYQITPKGDEVMKYFMLAKNLLQPISLLDRP
jgi:predicted transcriptional regulator